MPFKSEKQRRYLWATQPDLAKRWAHKYPESNKGLPMYAKDNNAKDKASPQQGGEKRSTLSFFDNLTQIVKNNAVRQIAVFNNSAPGSQKVADSKQERVEIPHSEEPTYAGEERAKGLIGQEFNDHGGNMPSGASGAPAGINALLQKLSVVLSPKVREMLAAQQAAQQGQQPGPVAQNQGIKQYPAAAPIAPPMGMAPGQAPQAQAQPQQAQQGAPATPQMPGVGGGTSPNANPINSYGGLSTSGDINGNAAFGTQNAIGARKFAAQKQSGLLLRDLDAPEPISMPVGKDGEMFQLAEQYRKPRLLAKPFYHGSDRALVEAMSQMAMIDPTLLDRGVDSGKPFTTQDAMNFGLNLKFLYPDRFRLPPEGERALGNNPDAADARRGALDFIKKTSAAIEKWAFDPTAAAAIVGGGLGLGALGLGGAYLLGNGPNSRKGRAAGKDWAPPSPPEDNWQDENYDYEAYDKQYAQWEKDLRQYLKTKGYSHIRQHDYEPGGTPLSMRGRDGKYYEMWYPEPDEPIRAPVALEDIYDSGDPKQVYRKGPGLVLVGPKQAASSPARQRIQGAIEKWAGVYGHFIHAQGLSPKERKFLQQQAQAVARFRQGVYLSQLEQLQKEWPGEKIEYQTGGSSNFRDDVLELFKEKYPNANVWPGNAIQFQKFGPRRWFGLRRGKELPAGEGYAVLMSHYPKDLSMDSATDAYQPDFDVATDFYGDVDDDVHDSLAKITGGRYAKPTAAKTASSSPAWQRSAGKNPEGGLNEKGRKSYERETGGNLKAPVTESNPSGERAKRQNSFCSRMCGMKRVNTGAQTKSDPDSRINKSLRKWNCKCSSFQRAVEKWAGLADAFRAGARGARAGREISEHMEQDAFGNDDNNDGVPGGDLSPMNLALATALLSAGAYGVYHKGQELLNPAGAKKKKKRYG